MRAFLSTKRCLPSEVREGLVGICHAVHVVLLLDSRTFVLSCHKDLGSEALRHWLTLLRARCVDDPTVCERNAALLRNLAWHLVVCTTDATGADFHEWRHVADSSLKGLERVELLCLDKVEGTVHELACCVLLTVPHNRVNEARNSFRLVYEVWTTWVLVLYGMTHGMRKRLCLRALSTVLRTSTATLVEACGIKASADDGVLDTDVLHAATAKHNHGVLLEVVALSGDVGSYFHAVGEAHAGDLTDSRVRFARGLGGHLHAHATLKGRRVEGWAVLKRVETTTKGHNLCLLRCGLAWLLCELIDGCHCEMKTPPRELKALYKRPPGNANT